MADSPKEEEHELLVAYRELCDAKEKCRKIKGDLKAFGKNAPDVKLAPKLEEAHGHIVQAISSMESAAGHIQDAYRLID